MKLATKLMLLFLLLTTIPLTVVGYLAYEDGRRTIEQNTINRLISTNIYKEAEFERWVEDNGQRLRSLAGRPYFKDQFAAEIAAHDPADPEHQLVHRRIREDHFLPTFEEEGGFIELFILRASDGLILVSTDEKQEGKYRESEPYFVEGKNRTYVQNVTYSLALGEAVMHISTPIRDREGNLLAVLAGHVNLAEMSEIMGQRSGLSQTEETYLVNTFNFFVTESRFEPGYALKKALYTEGVETCLDAQARNDGVGFYADYRGVPVIGAYRWIPQRELCILTEVDQAEAYAPIVALRNTVLRIGVAVALIVALLGVVFARTLTGPVRQLVKGAEEIGRGNLEYRIGVSGKDEIGQLAGAFNEMAANLRASLGETAHSQRLLLALSQAAQAVQRARTPEEVYRTVGDEVVRLGYHTVIFTLTDDQAHLALAYMTFEPAPLRAAEKLAGLSAQDFHFPVSPGSAYDRVIAAGLTAFFEKAVEPMAESLPAPVRPLARRLAAMLGLEQAIFALLRVGGETIGLLLVTGAGLTEADVPAVTTFANQTAIALENARAEAALRESEQWLSTTLRSIGDAVMATDSRGLVTLMNPVAVELTGWDESEAVGKPLEDVFHIVNEQTGERAEHPVTRVLREGIVVGLANHTVLIAKDGTKRPIADSGAPIRDDEGNIIGTVMVFRDITERVRAESLRDATLEALERRMAELSALNAMAAIVNESLEVDEILNRAMDEALRVVGVEAAGIFLLDDPSATLRRSSERGEAGELVMVAHRGISDEFVRAANRIKLGEEMTGRAAQTGAPVVIGHMAEHPGGLQAFLEKETLRSAASVPLIGSAGVIGAMTLATASPQYFDATGLELLVALGQQIAIGVEKARLYEAIRASEEKYKALVENATDFIFMVDKNDEVLSINRMGARLFGRETEEIIGQSLFDLFPKEIASNFSKNLKTVFDTGESSSSETRMVVRGKEFWISASLSPVRDHAGKVVAVMGASRDITGRKEMQERLVRQEKLAVLGQLAGGVGHELRNPLGAIKNAVYFLDMVTEAPDPETKEMLEILQQEVTKSEGIISDLLDFARTRPPTRRKIAINAVVQETLSRIDVPESIEVISRLEEISPVILADPDQLDQIFSNILHNGIQALPEGGQLTLETGLESPEWLAVTIADTGVGMPAETLAKIFEPLFTTRAKGIGLGLAIVKTLVEGHGGTVAAESKPGQGSRFTVRLPFQGAGKGT